ncbi:RimK family alpha-L-glutamate ligase [Oceanobacillus luteolus]|uniref:ATP-grasp domain-containing protein n=1 Tax=Oceanobacillus luteolus TaxID=1274358 RepID=UPI00203CB60E|nr:RimK family alpha-L-glutamate ligase [Oceanobacillus luteolus]MCM3742136.1 RimK family alpha-L-glutamate ligase [Oceanobacillus luteolus]
MKTTGWIIYNGNLPGNKFLDYAEMLQAAANKLQSNAHLFKNNELMSVLSTSTLDLLSIDKKPDYVVFTDKDIYLARQLEYLNIPVFNSAHAIATSDDKIATYQELARKKLPIPKTIIAPKIFIEGSFPDFLIDQTIKELGLPLVIKEAFGSFGEQVYLVHTREELVEIIQTIGNKPFVFQEFISTSYGVDIRLQVVGNEVVAGMQRKSLDDFRANITAGGTMQPYEATQEEKKIAIEATKAIGANFAGVDLLFGKDGPLICEVNSNAHIRYLLDCTKINAADFIMSFIMKQLSA